MKPNTAARRYAQAAFAVAQEDGDPRLWLDSLQGAVDALGEPGAWEFFRNPAIPEESKRAAVERAFGSSPPHILNLLRLLAAHGRLGLLPGIVREFAALYREAQGIVEASVTVAHGLSEEERARVTRQLSDSLGKTVELNVRVDPSILGGIVIRVGDRLIDASVAGRLQRLRQEMTV